MQNVNALPPTGRLGHPLNKFTLALYLLLLIWPAVFIYINPYAGFGSDTLWGTVNLIDVGGQAILALVLGIIAGMAAMKSNSSELRRRVGARLGFTFGVLGLIAYLLALIPGFSRMPLMSILVPLLFFVLSVVLFLSWAIARPFRGFGYLGILVGVISLDIVMVLDALLFPLMLQNPAMMTIFGIIFGVAPTVLAVVGGILLEKITPRGAPTV